MHLNEDYNVAARKDMHLHENSKLAVKVEGLEKSFGTLKVLQGISTEIRKGEVVAIIGPSGSGSQPFCAA